MNEILRVCDYMSNFVSDIVRQFQIIRMIMKEQPEFHLNQNVCIYWQKSRDINFKDIFQA